jgi:6-phosphogluconolactonase
MKEVMMHTMVAMTAPWLELIDGIAQPGRFEASFGAVPFGFAVDRRDRLVVSEAAGSAVTSYDLDTDAGRLSVISGSVPTNQAAACWVAETPNGRARFDRQLFSRRREP